MLTQVPQPLQPTHSWEPDPCSAVMLQKYKLATGGDSMGADSFWSVASHSRWEGPKMVCPRHGSCQHGFTVSLEETRVR